MICNIDIHPIVCSVKKEQRKIERHCIESIDQWSSRKRSRHQNRRERSFTVTPLAIRSDFQTGSFAFATYPDAFATLA